MSTERPDQTTVLVVDDERGLADLYAVWLADEYEVDTAYSGQEGIDRLDEDTDVIFLDRRMPAMSGDAVLEHVREHGYDCYVAMVTGVDPDFDIIEMGFDDYLVKPVSQDDLNATVEKFLELVAFDDEVRELAALAEKCATLEAQKSAATLQHSDEYEKLHDDIAALQESTTGQLEGFGDDEFRVALDRVTAPND